MAVNKALMKHSRPVVDRRMVVGALAALGFGIAGPGGANAAEPAGQVELAKGLSTGLLNGGVRDLEVGSEVFLEELVQTYRAARLGLVLGSATRVHLGERTRLKIEKSVVDEGGQLLLERGALLFDGPAGDAAEEPLTRTPFAIIAARGTRYFVGPSNDVIGVFCEIGSVSVRNRGGRVVLGAGEGTNLTSPDIAPTPPVPWGPPRIEAALASVT
jgi:ferric-dicitrate binding protein FerR (iron transport regulator)